MYTNCPMIVRISNMITRFFPLKRSHTEVTTTASTNGCHPAVMSTATDASDLFPAKSYATTFTVYVPSSRSLSMKPIFASSGVISIASPPAIDISYLAMPEVMSSASKVRSGNDVAELPARTLISKRSGGRVSIMSFRWRILPHPT